MNFAAPIPMLRSFDEAKTREFYIDFLGFTVEFEHRFAPDAPLYMGVRRGDCVLHLSEHFGDGVPGTAMRVPVRDVDALVADLNAKGYRHAHPGAAQDMPWGTRDIVISDPAGNRICFYSEGKNGAS